MIFIDTNIFLRFLIKDIPSQFEESRELFLSAAREETILITSTIVIFELEWVLGDFYQLPKEEIIPVLEEVLQLKVILEEKQIVLKALDIFKDKKLDLEDCYNLVYARLKGVDAFKTFDKKLLNNWKSKSF